MNLIELKMSAGNVKEAIIILNKMKSLRDAIIQLLNNNDIEGHITSSMTKADIISRLTEYRVLAGNASSIIATTLKLTEITGVKGVMGILPDGKFNMSPIKFTHIDYGSNYRGVLKVVDNKVVLSNVILTTNITNYNGPVTTGASGTINFGQVNMSTVSKLTPYIHTVPTGVICEYSMMTAPAGWAICDGSNIPSDNTFLINLLGSSKLPDIRGRCIRVYDDREVPIDIDRDYRTHPITSVVGNNIGSIQTDAFQKHAHTLVRTPSSSTNKLGLGATIAAIPPPSVTPININSTLVPTKSLGDVINSASNLNTSNSSIMESDPSCAYAQYIIKL